MKDWNWRKVLTWAGAIAFVYVGSRLTLAGVNLAALLEYERRDGTTSGGLLGLYELVFQGGLHRAAVLGLGIMPYLTARIYMWLWRVVNPGAATSKAKTRALTLALSLIQGFGFAAFLQRLPGVVAEPGAGFITRTVLTVTAASLVAMWFGEQLTRTNDEDGHPTIDEIPGLRGELPDGNFAHAIDPAAADRPEPDLVRK